MFINYGAPYSTLWINYFLTPLEHIPPTYSVYENNRRYPRLNEADAENNRSILTKDRKDRGGEDIWTAVRRMRRHENHCLLGTTTAMCFRRTN